MEYVRKQPPLWALCMILGSAMLVLPVAGCGKRGSPKPSGEGEVTYPASYPQDEAKPGALPPFASQTSQERD